MLRVREHHIAFIVELHNEVVASLARAAPKHHNTIRCDLCDLLDAFGFEMLPQFHGEARRYIAFVPRVLRQVEAHAGFYEQQQLWRIWFRQLKHIPETAAGACVRSLHVEKRHDGAQERNGGGSMRTFSGSRRTRWRCDSPTRAATKTAPSRTHRVTKTWSSVAGYSLLTSPRHFTSDFFVRPSRRASWRVREAGGFLFTPRADGRRRSHRPAPSRMRAANVMVVALLITFSGSLLAYSPMTAWRSTSRKRRGRSRVTRRSLQHFFCLQELDAQTLPPMVHVQLC